MQKWYFLSIVMFSFNQLELPIWITTEIKEKFREK